MKYLHIAAALACFIILAAINQLFYHNVMPLTVVIVLLVNYLLFFRNTTRLRHLIYWLIFSVCLFISWPGVTFNEAKAKVQNGYDIVITVKDTVPVTGGNEWNPFSQDWFYYFRGTGTDDKRIDFMVDPRTGRIVEMMR